MNIMLLAATVGTMLAVGSPLDHSATRGDMRTTPPAAWADADPADSLYRAARRALTQKDYDAAARLFDSIVARFPRSEYAPDALYWKGFALYRSGSLEPAVDALEMQAKKYPSASTHGDTATLLIVIKGELAKRGDANAQHDVSAAATASSQGRNCGDMEVQTAALDALQQMDSERVTPLLRKVLARRDACSTPLRKNALFILSQRTNADREKILLDVAKGDPDPGVRSDAVFHLSQAKSAAAVDALEDLLLHSTEPGVRNNALFALAQNRSERSRKIVKALALSDDAPQSLRNDAIFQIASAKDADDVAWLKDAYGKVRDDKLRTEIMFQLASRPGPETTNWLASVISDGRNNIEQRKNALFHLASRRDATSLDRLIAVAKNDTSPTMRKEALFHIGQSRDPRALKALEEIVAP